MLLVPRWFARNLDEKKSSTVWHTKDSLEEVLLSLGLSVGFKNLGASETLGDWYQERRAADGR